VTSSSQDSSIQKTFLNGRVVVRVGDITQQHVSALVNAANWTLLGGGGVDGAIHRAGGPGILQECQRIRETEYPNGLPTGKAVATTAGNLPAQYVIHTVGPIYGRDRENQAELLADCYRNSLELAASLAISSVAFPSISTGAFGYPREEAAAIASRAIKEALSHNLAVKEVRLVFFLKNDARVFLQFQNFE
jgi:O-acetyl-ADP-ribose deacetylase (regulator of RNase III)